MPALIGFGCPDSHIHFYIANRPPIDDYPQMQELRGLASGEIAHIVKNTSNHWRKVFNVYAKLLFDWQALIPHKSQRFVHHENWQSLRDETLFQENSHASLLFNRPDVDRKSNAIRIIAGKTYAASLDLPALEWLDNFFAINKEYRLIVSPYPDYRQLSNARIAQLITLMQSMD
ncbi:hypothetical protein TDB9533_00584 [Thalassocella blandensis]|nr:hypothetical protein TDB9533_00584 [Thalassocella blandensis]